MSHKGSWDRTADLKKAGDSHDSIFGIKCPHCDNSGVLPAAPPSGEIEQCRWCWETPNSKFNKRMAAAAKQQINNE